MLEAPEALYLSRQLEQLLKGKQITEVLAGYTPHKFVFWYGTPEEFVSRLCGNSVTSVRPQGGMVELTAGRSKLVFTDGVNLSYIEPGGKLPGKYQLLVGFRDQSCLVASVRMYGGIFAIRDNMFDASISEYYRSAVSKPQVMSADFTEAYFLELINAEAVQKKSAKAFLATGQTIPGLGNGVLQDILYEAGIHPKTKIHLLSSVKRKELYFYVTTTLRRIAENGGRNSETDLFGVPGNYIPYLSKDTAGKECGRCGSIIRKESYLGGSIYYCPGCQPV